MRIGSCSNLVVPLVLILCIATFPAVDRSRAATPAGSNDAAQDVHLGSPVHVTKIKVPKKLRKRELAAVVSATLTPTGTFENLQVLGGDNELGASALDAVRQWRYTPSMMDGKAVLQNVFITVQSEKGKVESSIETDTLPTQPPGIEAQISTGTLLRVDPRRMKAPRAVYSPDPQYSEEARRAKYQGDMVLGLILGADGKPEDVWVVKKLGLGLDQNALATVRQWKFEPAMDDGKGMRVLLDVDVTFRIY